MRLFCFLFPFLFSSRKIEKFLILFFIRILILFAVGLYDLKMTDDKVIEKFLSYHMSLTYKYM